MFSTQQQSEQETKSLIYKSILFIFAGLTVDHTKISHWNMYGYVQVTVKILFILLFVERPCGSWDASGLV